LGPEPPLAFAAAAAASAAVPAAALLAIAAAGDCVSGRRGPLTPVVPSAAVLGVSPAGPAGRSCLLLAAAAAPVSTAAPAAVADADPMLGCLVNVPDASAARPAPGLVDRAAPFVAMLDAATGCFDAVLVEGIQEVSAAGGRSSPCACGLSKPTDDISWCSDAPVTVHAAVLADSLLLHD
jgi:hypothetical protein